jgi:hypothetical protein
LGATPIAIKIAVADPPVAIGMPRTTLAALLTLPLPTEPIGAGSQRVLPPLSCGSAPHVVPAGRRRSKPT